jgi:hypothetical protein
MDFVLDTNDYSDEEELEVADLPEWFVQEEMYYSKLNSINQFKHSITMEPEFYGIRNLSDVELLNFIENTDSSSKKVKPQLTDYQYELFDDIHKVLFGVKNSRNIYDKIALKIFNRCYI